jgi:RNA polymerase sigma-70 factor (ECF subfamily)
VAQEAVLRAWRMRHQCSDPARPWPWLSRICQREAARLAARRRTSHLPDGHEPSEPSSADETVQRLAVTAAVAELAPLDRELISHRYGEDRTYRWIAGALSMPEGTVKVRLHRARRQLEQILGEEV